MMMNILAIETTGKYGSAAVIRSDGSLFCASSSEEMNHLKGMMILIDEAIKKAGISKKELTHIAASAGPGSFTGIRIGVVTARTMAQMLGIPCIAVSSLEAMGIRVLSQAVEDGAVFVAPIINARRHQTYAAVYEAARGNDGALTAAMEEKQYIIEDLLTALNEKLAGTDSAKVFFTGDGIDAYRDIIEEMMPAGSYMLADEEIRYQHAGSVAEAALRKAAASETLGYNELMPEYMRLAEAEQRLKSGTLSDKIRRPVQK